MSLESFQQVLAAAAASPQLCVEWRAHGPPRDQYVLTDAERDRVLSVIRHPGMSHNCTLYRSNRITPLVRSLPRAVTLLGDDLSDALERFWADNPDAELQFRVEAELFGRFLTAEALRTDNQHLLDAVRSDLAGLHELYGQSVDH